MKKRGLGHVEAILSFVLFIGFLIFAFFFFNPFQSNRTLDSTLFYAFDEIADNASIAMESYSVVVNETMPNVVGINLNPTIPMPFLKFRVEDINGAMLPYNLANNNIFFQRGSNRFIIVRFADDLQPCFLTNCLTLGGGEPVLSGENYSVSSSEKKEIFSEIRILALNNTYYTNYNSLKNEFNLPSRTDFGFRFVLNDTYAIIGEREVPEGLEVLSKNERVEVVRGNGDIVFADFVVKVW